MRPGHPPADDRLFPVHPESAYQGLEKTWTCVSLWDFVLPQVLGRTAHVHEFTLPCVWGPRLPVRAAVVRQRWGPVDHQARTPRVALFGVRFVGGPAQRRGTA